MTDIFQLTVERNREAGHLRRVKRVVLATALGLPGSGHRGPSQRSLLLLLVLLCGTVLFGARARAVEPIPPIEDQRARVELIHTQAWARWGELGHTAVLVGPTTLLTSYHCIEREGTRSIYLEFNGDGTREWGKMERIDEDNLAVIRIPDTHGHEAMMFFQLSHTATVPFAVNWQLLSDDWWRRTRSRKGQDCTPENQEILHTSTSSGSSSTQNDCPNGAFFAAYRTSANPDLDASWATLGHEVETGNDEVSSWASIPSSPALPEPNQVHQVEVTIYTASWCGGCRELERWLNRRGTPFVTVDIDTDSARWGASKRKARADGVNVRGVLLAEIRNGSSTRWIYGFDEVELARSLGG